MSAKSFLAAAILLLLPIGASAQGGRLTFDQAAYVTCREAQAMEPDARRYHRVPFGRRPTVLSQNPS